VNDRVRVAGELSPAYRSMAPGSTTNRPRLSSNPKSLRSAVRVVLVGTYRLDEARAHPRLRSLVRSLQRLGLAEEMTLTPLSADVSTADRSSQTSDGGRNQHTSRCRRGAGSLSSSATSSLIMTNRFTVGTV
jgi:hypothetical protein